MSITTSAPDYEEITKALQDLQTPYHTTQIHGLICGFICGTSGNTHFNWQDITKNNTQHQEAITALERLYEFSYQHISEFSFEFNLLLPEDDTDLGSRTEALGLWCQGFLSGLNQTQANFDNAPEEITETLEDLTEIAQVNFEDMTENEEDETAYFELNEYVRLAVLMIFHELKSGDKIITDDGDHYHDDENEDKEDEMTRKNNRLH